MGAKLSAPLLDAQQTRKTDMLMMKRRYRRKYRAADFTDIQSIDKGSFGDVTRGRLKATQHYVALKKMDFRVQLRENSFYTEVKMLRMLRHHHIIKLYGHFHDHQCGYLILPLALRDAYVRNTIVHPKTVLLYTHQALLALEYLEKKLILHRDIKPQNLLIYPGDMLRLGDCGTAVQVRLPDKTCSQAGPGTNSYMAIERHLVNPYSFKSDLWSLIVTMAQVTQRVHPYSYWEGDVRPTAEKLRTRILNGKRFIAPDFPKELINIVITVLIEEEFRPNATQVKRMVAKDLREM